MPKAHYPYNSIESALARSLYVRIQHSMRMTRQSAGTDIVSRRMIVHISHPTRAPTGDFCSQSGITLAVEPT